MQTVKQLYDLQELDSNIHAVQNSVEEARAKLADDSPLISARSRVASLEGRSTDLAAKRREAERTIAELQERLQRIESRLYGGAVTNPRELSAAQEEREFTMRQLREGEDELLETMVEMEDVQSEQREAQEALARLESERPVQEADLLKEEERLISELAMLTEERDRITPLVASEVLSLYNSLRKLRDGRAWHIQLVAVALADRGWQ